MKEIWALVVRVTAARSKRKKGRYDSCQTYVGCKTQNAYKEFGIKVNLLPQLHYSKNHTGNVNTSTTDILAVAVARGK